MKQTCLKCDKEKDASEFNKAPTKSGLGLYCKACIEITDLELFRYKHYDFGKVYERENVLPPIEDIILFKKEPTSNCKACNGTGKIDCGCPEDLYDEATGSCTRCANTGKFKCLMCEINKL